MFLGVTTAGWVLLGILYLPLALVALAFLGRRIKGSTLGQVVILGIAALVLFALPVSDAAVSQWRMRQLCPEAGLKVNRRVLVDGYFDEERSPIGSPERIHNLPAILKATGYRFWEYRIPLTDRFERTALTADGKVEQFELSRPTARYHHKKRAFSSMGGGIERSEQRIVDAETGEDVAVDITIGRLPGFVDRLWLGWFGPIQPLETCYQPGAPTLVTELRLILIPTSK
jgi:hypothetical protein